MNNIQKLKQFVSIAKPNKALWAFNIIFWIIYYLLGLYLAVPSANAINSITIGDLNGTIKWLIITCAVVIVQQLCNFIIDRIYYKSLGDVWRNVNSKIYDKVSTATKESFLDTSKEKIINIVCNNMGTMADFPNNFAKYVSYFLQAVVTIIILLSYNLIIGATIILVCVLLYFIQSALNKRIGHWTDKHYDEQDKSLENLADNYTNHELTSDLALTDTMRNKYLKHLEKSQTYKYKFGMLYSTTENWVPLLYKVIICALSIYMVYLTKSNVFTLTLYLILTNYLTQAITQMSSSYTILDKINNVHVACLRIKNILDMKPEDLVEFGNNTSDDITGEIVFTNASYTAKTNDFVGIIDKFNLKIAKNSSTLIYGSPKCGKRAIFYMLNRSVRPTSGTITIDNINILDFDKEAYKHNVAVASSKEYFYNDSIMENLLLSGSNKTEIYKVCKELGIHNKIVQSKNSYNSNLTKEPYVLNNLETYLLGLARAICTKAEILVLYEFPSGLSLEQKNLIATILKTLSASHTLIVFSHNDWAKCVCKNLYKVEKSKISKQSNK